MHARVRERGGHGTPFTTFRFASSGTHERMGRARDHFENRSGHEVIEIARAS